MNMGSGASWRRTCSCVLAVAALLAGWRGAVAAAPTTTTSTAARRPQAVQTYRRWVNALADESMEGRGAGTAGLVKARDYLIEQFKSMGAKPAFGDSFTQPFAIPIGMKAKRQELSILDGDGKEFAEAKPGRDVSAFGFSGNGSFRGRAVFVGYGIVDRERGYDSYARAGPDALRGKVAIAFRYEPQNKQGRSLWAKRTRWTRAAVLSNKAQWAADHGAAALLVVNPPSHSAGEKLRTARETRSTLREKIPVMHIRLALFEQMLRSAGQNADEAVRRLQARADAGAGRPKELPGVFVRGRVEVTRKSESVHNVAAVVPGAGELAREVVVVGGHYDHLGRRGAILPGADDNASGTAGVLMLAKWFSQRVAARAGAGAPAARRTLVFAAFAAEERGLIGSRHMAAHLDDLAVKSARVVAMINLDVIGRLKPGAARAQGVNSADRWPEIVGRASKQAKLDVLSRGSARTGSDHLSFYRRRVPVLHVCTGYGAHLHTPRDTPDKINAAGAVRVLGFVEAIVSELWTTPEPPTYKPAEWFGRFAGGAYLGVRADPASARATDGCKLLEVLPDTPAGKAGLRAGDVVVAWNGKATPDLRAMLSQVRAGKPGDTVKVKVRRDGKVIEIAVKLGRR